ncbi:uncharacterized protein At2g29880-like [Pyrus x bretschneideri]|uniref:uncharacterized protein At2g29880-like n=1 Tax=Pyrus x bretschneideri TaxID=225117 RepID=UPI00202E78BF|nr:uncharacterized protein At2g29880-like [Pyrus x bretschneideri]
MGDEQQEIGKVKAKSDYSAWTLEESKVLLQLLVEATLRGWHDANGLLTKDIVTTRILPALNERLKCNKTYKHYTSRMRYVKKEYGKYSQLMGSNSGFGWDANTKRFVADDEVWEEYFRAHPDQRSIRKKSCDDFEDLQIILGDATATGRHSLGLDEETDARTFVVEDRQSGTEEDEQVGIENLFYDEENGGFVLNQNQESHQTSSFDQSSPFLPTQATSLEIPLEITNRRKRNRTQYQGNTRSSETTNQAKIMENISLTLGSIATDFRGVHSLLEKRDKDRERQNSIWDVIKETPNLDEPTCYQAVALLDAKTKKDTFLKMSPKERSN